MAKAGMLENLINSPVAGKLGVPQGEELRRYAPGQPTLDGPAVICGSGRYSADLEGLLAQDYEFIPANADTPRAAIVFDATGIGKPEDLHELFDALNPQMRKLRPCARVVVLGITPELLTGPENTDARICQRALEGFTRSLAKELRRGATAQLVYLAPGTELSPAESTLRFLLSGKSAFVDGQVIRVGGATAPAPESWDKPLLGRLAVVTGSARGIGKTMAEVLARDGASVICVDVPAAGEALTQTANSVKGTALSLDVTDPRAATVIAEHAKARYGRKIDVLVHNAGVTRDKLLVNMDEKMWAMVQNINLVAPVRITEGLIESGQLAENPAIIGVSSIAGIAGNRGQTNYATTKAGMIGLVDSLKDALAERGGTINAVAPGFIETAMTAAMPTLPREVGRKSCSLKQGGQTIDVAETVAYLAAPSSRAVTGNVIRVCGQSIMGA
ncbi:3-oxoacyl-ACP reductase [Corynebacterium vitaeruminis]|uniref:3-oxoacyl-ACP reductase n=1 Tax=Corynebacterium vitaeruminis TaxID=38305 RepID=UPI0023F0EE55|nr:3-oxoacyl-ACP reductase [Corynebacterium vitaeruminis]